MWRRLKESWKCSISLIHSNGYSWPRELVIVRLQAPVEYEAFKAHQIGTGIKVNITEVFKIIRGTVLCSVMPSV